MRWIESNCRWIMLVTGALTATMIHVAIAPRQALQSSFGETLEGPLAEVVVRGWGALIALVGAMLIYGAFRPVHRPLILTIAAISKAFFVLLVVRQGWRFLGQPAGAAVVVDSLMVILFALCLMGGRSGRAHAS